MLTRHASTTSRLHSCLLLQSTTLRSILSLYLHNLSSDIPKMKGTITLSARPRTGRLGPIRPRKSDPPIRTATPSELCTTCRTALPRSSLSLLTWSKKVYSVYFGPHPDYSIRTIYRGLRSLSKDGTTIFPDTCTSQPTTITTSHHERRR